MADTLGFPDDFDSAYQAAAVRLFERISAACAAPVAWPLRVRNAIGTVLDLFAAEPDLGRLFVFAPYEVSGEAQLRHEANLVRLAELLRAGGEEIGAPSVPDIVEEGLIGGAIFIIGRPLRAGEPDLLPALAPELTALILTPYIGREEAERIAMGE
jgi:hypothetical protein